MLAQVLLGQARLAVGLAGLGDDLIWWYAETAVGRYFNGRIMLYFAREKNV